MRAAVVVLGFLHAIRLVAASGPDSAPGFHREVLPVLRANCAGCHRPGKSKGGLDLTSHAALMRGGDSGPAVVAGEPERSELLEQVRGEFPEMPKDGEPLSASEQAVLRRWILAGALEGTPVAEQPRRADSTPEYRTLPSITALAWSPDGSTLAVPGRHEIVLHDSATNRIVARLVGDSSKLTSLLYSRDGATLAAAGGAPARFGEIQFWDPRERRSKGVIRRQGDTWFGLAFSPDEGRVVVGGADKVVRVFRVADGTEAMHAELHLDWVLGTTFSSDGNRVVSASRDKALKLIDAFTGVLVDDVNRAREPLSSLAGYPTENMLVAGSDSGGLRVHRMEPRGGRLAEGDDKELSFVRELERLPGPVQAIAWSSDGHWIAAGCDTGEVRVFKASDGRRQTTIPGKAGPTFALAFSPDGIRIAAAGHDGKVRVYSVDKGEWIREFDGVPLVP